MKLELEILDGKNKGQRVSLRNGLLLGHSLGKLQFDDLEMQERHAIITFDLKNSWNIECLAPAKMRLGFDEVSRATLIKGLVFHLGQTGFKVVEKISTDARPWKEELLEWFEEHPAKSFNTEVFFFLRPVRLLFIQGPQYEDLYTLSYGPRELGYNHLDLNLKDPSSPTKAARFFQVGDQAFVENLCGQQATINAKNFDQHLIRSGDILRIGSSVIELSILE
jgi:hypothetical protein